jgi:hypothetical protein
MFIKLGRNFGTRCVAHVHTHVVQKVKANMKNTEGTNICKRLHPPLYLAQQAWGGFLSYDLLGFFWNDHTNLSILSTSQEPL